MKNINVSDEAYKYDGGPLLLLAGPGTGKTYQLVQRIKFLINEKPPSFCCLAETRGLDIYIAKSNL